MSFLQNYRTFCSGNEAHPTYHTFAALSALSALTQRKIWIDLGYFKIFPNLYTVLVGPAGGRKTTAMDICCKLIEKMNNIPFMTDCVTKEKLIMDIRAEERTVQEMPDLYKDQKIVSPTALFLTELSDFLGPSSVGMINFLTAIYDRDTYTYKTKNKGSEKLVGPYLTILACTTPEWITTYLRSDVISGGFSRRTLFVYEWEEGKRIPRPKITDEMVVAWDEVLRHARAIQKLAGPMKWSPDAAKFFDDWYINLKIPTDNTVVGYYKSKHIQLIKVAMLLSLAESTNMVLETRHLQFGLELLGMMETNLLRVFQGMGRNELHSIAQKGLDLLLVSPKETILRDDGSKMEVHVMPEKQFRGMLYRDAAGRDVEDIINHLISTDRIGKVMRKVGEINKHYIYLKP